MPEHPVVPEYQSYGTGIPRGRWRSIFLVQAIQSSLIIAAAVLLCILAPDAAVYFLGGGVASCVMVAGLQILYLLPITEPQIDRARRKSLSQCISAAVAGLLTGILAFGVVGILGDFIWFQILHPDARSMEVNDPIIIILVAGAIVFLASWIIMTPLLYLFLRNGNPEKPLFKLACSLFLGTIVEALASIGIMAMMFKRHECICATFSFLALVASFAIGFLIFGPGVLLLILWKKSRYRPGGLCPACGADLLPIGLPSRCPRCGAGWKPCATPPTEPVA